MTLALTAALTFTPIGHDIQPCPEGTTEMWNVCVSDMVRRWIPAEYGKEARHRNHTSGDVTAPPSGTERWRSLVAAYFPPEHVDRALQVIRCESRYDPNADNPDSSAAGLWQFIRSTWNWVAGVLGLPSYDAGGPYDPDHATRAAAWLTVNGGWQHWNASRRCWG